MAAEITTGFLIDGKMHEVPALDSLTMGERRVMFELSGMVQEDLFQTADETEAEYEERATKLMRHPGLVEALMHVAYQRANPGLKREKVQFVIEGTHFLTAVSNLVRGEEPEEDEVPLASTTEPEPSSSNGPVDSESSTPPSNENGGTVSMMSSGRPASTRTSIGTTRSATSSPASPERTSAP